MTEATIIGFKCPACKETVEISEKDLEVLGNMSDEYNLTLSDYLIMASTIIKGKEKCKNSSGRHTWIFGEETEEKINSFITAKANKEQQLTILSNKDEKISEELIELKEAWDKIGKEIDAKSTERTNLTNERITANEEVTKLTSEMSEIMKIKKLDKFL